MKEYTVVVCRYVQAKANDGLVVITTPYEDPVGAGRIITIATTVHVDETVFGVMGADVSSNIFLEIMTRSIAKCQTHE